MKTYINITPEVETKLVLDGNTGNPKIDKLLPILYKRLSVFEISITTDYKHSEGFRLKIKTHDSSQRFVFGTVVVEYQRFYYDNPTGRDEYTISGRGDDKYNHFWDTPIVAGYISTGTDFETVLEDFFAGSVELIGKRIKYLETQQKWAAKHLKNPKHKATRFFEPGEA